MKFSILKEKINKYDKIILLIIIFCSIYFTAICIHKGHNWGGDFSMYIAQAISINNHSLSHLYELNKFSMDHSDFLFGPYLYPEGFPLILSVVYFFRGVDFITMKWVCAIFFIASLPLIYLMSKILLTDKKYALLIVACVALSEGFLTFADNILSDIPFFFFSLLSLFLIERSKNIFTQILLGILIFYTYFVRDIGIVLIPTLFVYQIQLIFKNKQNIKSRIPYLITPYLIFSVLFVLKTMFLINGEANHNNILFVRSVPYHYLIYYSELLSDFLFNTNISFYWWLPLLLVIFTGMYYQLKKGVHIVVYVLLVFFIDIMWPAKQGIRFLFPIIPFILFFLFRGFLSICDATKNRYFKYMKILIFVLTIVIIYHGIKGAKQFSRVYTNTVKTEEMDEIYNFIIDNTNKDAIVMFNNPRVLRLFTDRNSFSSSNKDTIHRYADFVLMNKADTVYDNQLNSIFDTQNYILFKNSNKIVGE